MRAIALSILLILLNSISSQCQNYLVLKAKRTFKVDGGRVKKGDFLYRHDTIVVNENGRLILDVESKIDLFLRPGTYSIEVADARHTILYKDHDSLRNVLKPPFLIYTIRADDCRSSGTYAIAIKR